MPVDSFRIHVLWKKSLRKLESGIFQMFWTSSDFSAHWNSQSYSFSFDGVTELIKYNLASVRQSNRSIKENFYYLFSSMRVLQQKKISFCKRKKKKSASLTLHTNDNGDAFFSGRSMLFSFFGKLIGIQCIEGLPANYHHIFHKNSQNLNWKCRKYLFLLLAYGVCVCEGIWVRPAICSVCH